MHINRSSLVVALLSLAPLLQSGAAEAADLPPVKAVKKAAVADAPFFLVNDNRISYAWMPKGTDPGIFTVRPDGSINGTTAKSVYAFTHFDVWAYGTNFFTIDLAKSDKNDPANPCVNGVPGGPTGCAGAVEVYGLARSTFGFNEIFNTKAFSYGPLRNVSLEVGADMGTANYYLAFTQQKFLGGLQFAFDLPYNGYLNIAPLVYNEVKHNAFLQCGGPFAPGAIPGVSCLGDGVRHGDTSWAVEINYSMDLGFLPESMQYFMISGRAAWYGPKGYENALPAPAGGTKTVTEFNSEPIRLTFDASKAALGAKYSHNLDLWVAYRYWDNKLGFDAKTSAICNVAPGVSNHTCTESTVYAGVTAKF